MAKQRLPYRSEVVGSLLRPGYLKDAIERADRGELDADGLRAVQDRAALEAIALQEACGLDVITDGEVRRKFWFDPLTASLSGYNPEVPAPVPFKAAEGQPAEPPPKLPAVTDKLGYRTNLPLEEFGFLRAHAHTPVKTTIAGMTYASVLWVPGYSDDVYPDRDAYMAEALELMTRVVGEVVDAGTTYVQLDSPRAGTFEPLRFVPEDKVVVLGLVTTKEPELEDAGQLKRRIEEASAFVPLERLALSPQCGFASTLPGNLVTFEDQRAKLELVAAAARDVWS